MDRFEAMQLFVAVAERQSFARAARDRSLSAARVTRAVAALEAVVGAKLLHRTTRAVRLTEAGASYLGQCKRILLEVEAAEAVAVGAGIQDAQLAVPPAGRRAGESKTKSMRRISQGSPDAPKLRGARATGPH